MTRIETADEVGHKKVFRWAVDWPGWARGARTSDLALEALIACASRYAIVTSEAGLTFPTDPATIGPRDLPLVESIVGSAGTDFGVPSGMTSHDRRPIDAVDADRHARLVQAAWVFLDRVVAAAPAELRKGPRGGGRDTAGMVDHVIDADQAYAREMGLHRSRPTVHDRAAVEAERAAMVELLSRPSDGSPLAGRRWTARYAARRIAWHTLDHAWEIEDRTEPGQGTGSSAD